MKNNMNSVQDNSYDKIPYISKSFSNTQASKLKSITKIFGFEAPEVENARVLEIGCSFGGNLIPMAMDNPNMELIGFDLSGVEVNEGNRVIERIGLKNIRLIEKNILDYDNSYGKFDYIICHGVFSWVPKIVQDKILDIIRESLKENGLAVVSYNTNPGWKNISILRDSMLFSEKIHSKIKETDDYRDIVNRGKEIVNFLKDYSVLGDEISKYVDNLSEKTNHYIYHEYYEKYNEAFYLHEMQDRLNEHGLTHICDSDINKTIPIYKRKDIDVEEMLEKECNGDRIAKEQYYDLLLNQQFRSSIITHKNLENKFHISKRVDKKNLNSIYVRQVFQKNEAGRYIYDDGEELSDNLQKLGEFLTNIYPNNIKISELVSHRELGDENTLYTNIFTMIYYKKLVISHKAFISKDILKPKLREEIKNYVNYFLEEENPIISFSAGSGVNVMLDKLQKESLLNLDGTNDKNSLTDLLVKRWENGEINIENMGNKNPKELLSKYAEAIFFVAFRFGFVEC